jgi:hypothetical protein
MVVFVVAQVHPFNIASDGFVLPIVTRGLIPLVVYFMNLTGLIGMILSITILNCGFPYIEAIKPIKADGVGIGYDLFVWGIAQIACLPSITAVIVSYFVLSSDMGVL